VLCQAKLTLREAEEHVKRLEKVLHQARITVEEARVRERFMIQGISAN
jgi:predicted nucleotidyltransferase